MPIPPAIPIPVPNATDQPIPPSSTPRVPIATDPPLPTASDLSSSHSAHASL